MLKDIYRYNAVTDEYRRRSRSNLWRVALTETGDVTRVVGWQPPEAIGHALYEGLELIEAKGGQVYLEAQDQLEAFAKALKMQEEKNGHTDNRF